MLSVIESGYFKVALYSTPCVSCGILYLVSQLIAKKPQLHAVTLKCTVLVEATANGDDDEQEEKYSDAKEDVDLETHKIENVAEVIAFLDMYIYHIILNFDCTVV